MLPLFEWDEAKAKRNLQKHKIGFPEGATVFRDAMVASMPDPDHSIDEERFVALGFSAHRRLLVVVYTRRGERIRIISCRKATTKERRVYEEGKE